MQLKTYQIFQCPPTRRDGIQDFDTRWDQAQLSASERSQENILEGLRKLNIRDSVQLQAVLAMYDEEIDRNLALPGYQRLKTMV